MKSRSTVLNNGWIIVVAIIALVTGSGAAARSEATNEHLPHDHAGHGGVPPTEPYTRRLARYATPMLTLHDSNGNDVALTELLSRDQPVLMQFIFTSCATICPLLSATFSIGQNELSKVNESFRMISISIDPEYDTPQRLAAYARRNNAGENWTFLTGSKSDIGKLMRSFDVLYQSDNKMYHQPYTFLRAGPNVPWVRIGGFLSVNDLVEEYRAALSLAAATSN